MKNLAHFSLLGLAISLAPALANSQTPFASQKSIYILANYGDTTTVEGAKQTLDKLAADVKSWGGGVIVIDNSTNKSFHPKNEYQTNIDDAKWIAPNSSSGYQDSDKYHPNLTIIDIRQGYIEIYPAPYGGRSSQSTYGDWFSGIGIKRTIDLQKEGMDPVGSFAGIDLTDTFLKGSLNFSLPLLEAVERGKEARLIFPHVVGLYDGARLASPRIDGKAEIITIRNISWDEKEHRNYATADLERSYPKGSVFTSKSNMPGISMMINNNADNQTAGHIALYSEKNGLGDDFLFNGMLSYSSDISNAAGDEGGVVYNAEVRQNLESFNGVVLQSDPTTNTLKFKSGRSAIPYSLSMSRPLINLNPQKWLTTGKVVIVASDEMLQDPVNKIGTKYKGTRFPQSGKTSDDTWTRGGLIESSADAPWDESIIGRYFSINEPTEYILGKTDFKTGYHYGPRDTPIRRWYEIVSFNRNPDGTKTIRVRRLFRNSMASGSVTLIDPENYTWDGHNRPLNYIIAPGALVSDISKGWQDLRNNYTAESHTPPVDQISIKLIPNHDRNSPYYFNEGDPVTQAIGPEPWIPRPLRIRMFNHFPSDIYNGAIEIFNYNTIAATYGIVLNGGPGSAEQISQRKDKRPSYLNGVLFNSTSSVGAGIRFSGYVSDAALLMDQKGGNPQPISWKSQNGRQISSIFADPADGVIKFTAPALDTQGGSLKNIGGLSGTNILSKNMRGINLSVPPGSRQAAVKFENVELDANYAVLVQANWLTMSSVTKKTKTGFSVEFNPPATPGASFDWILIR